MAGNGNKREWDGAGPSLRNAPGETLDALVEVFSPEELPPLVYQLDDYPGITRVRRGRGWSYHRPDGDLIRDPDERGRIEGLAIPPAWTDVWISTLPLGHIQATGRDAKGRKQYIYHPRWREVRDADKFHRLRRFGRALPAIRERADKDARRRKLSREKVVAIAVQLLDQTLIRVGNEEYARENAAFGLTTLRDSHAEISSSKVTFVFNAKGGKETSLDVRSPRLARAVKQCQELDGEELFQYVDDEGEPQPITSGDVNEYLRETGGEEFSAKDFRTWGGTVIVARTLAQLTPFSTKREADRNVNDALDRAAEHLNNTRAVARRSYVHPEVIQAYLEGELGALWPHLEAHAGDVDEMRSEEKALLRLLEHRGPPGTHRPH